MDLNIRNNFKGMKYPVGYLGPDGRWFLIERDDAGLVHLFLSDIVYGVYKDYIEKNHIFIHNPDIDLEHAGFIKVRVNEVRYYANAPYGGYYDQKDCRTPRVNDVQRKQLAEYAKSFGWEGKLWVNGARKRFSSNDFMNMDEIALQKAFARDY